MIRSPYLVRQTGDTLPTAVQIWVFAGNYVNVTTVPVDVAGDFSETFSTTGLLPATYYVFVESPGSNSDFNIDLAESGGFAGQVVNMATNSLIFNLTGAGSMKNENASQALSEAFSDPEVDDVYTKLTFQPERPEHNDSNNSLSHSPGSDIYGEVPPCRGNVRTCAGHWWIGCSKAQEKMSTLF